MRGAEASSLRNLFRVPQEVGQAPIFCHYELISDKLDNLTGQLIRLLILLTGVESEYK